MEQQTPSTSASGFELLSTAPELEEYLELRKTAGLSQKTPAQGLGALNGSWFFCHIRESSSGKLVAMGRVIGDGGWYFHIADMATDPNFQGQGLGKRIIDQLIDHIHTHAPENPYVTLIADPPGRRLYEKSGFNEINPSRGMELPWQREVGA